MKTLQSCGGWVRVGVGTKVSPGLLTFEVNEGKNKPITGEVLRGRVRPWERRGFRVLGLLRESGPSLLVYPSPYFLCVLSFEVGFVLIR